VSEGVSSREKGNLYPEPVWENANRGGGGGGLQEIRTWLGPSLKFFGPLQEARGVGGRKIAEKSTGLDFQRRFELIKETVNSQQGMNLCSWVSAGKENFVG